MPEERPPQEELVEARLAVERVPAGQAVVALEVERRQDLSFADETREPGRQRVERRDDLVAERVPAAVVVPARRRGARTACTGR